MTLLTSKYFAASIAFLCSGAVARSETPLPPDPQSRQGLLRGDMPAYRPLNGTLTIEPGGTADRIEGRVNLLAPIYRDPNDRDMFFFDGNWSGKGDGNENGSAGLGFRHRFHDPDIIVGVNAFYDYGDYSDRAYHQFGAGIEVLSKWIDFRANAYFPAHAEQAFGGYSRTDRTTSGSSRSSSRTSSATTVIDGGEGFFDDDGLHLFEDGSRTITTTRTTTSSPTESKRVRTYERREAAMRGFDLEVGGLVPYLDRWAETRIFVGYAFFDDPFGNDVSCLTARLESRPVPAVVLNVHYKGDSRLVDFENHWFFGARVEIPFDLSNLCHGQNPFAGITDAFTPQGSKLARNRMNEEIIRNWRPTVSRTGYERTFERRERQTGGTSTEVSRSVTVDPPQEVIIPFPG